MAPCGTWTRSVVRAAATLTLAGLGVALPCTVCAEQPRQGGTILRGAATATVTFQPPYGDLPLRALAAGEAP